MSNITTSTVSGQYQKYFSKDLLNYAVQETRLNEFAKKAAIPKNLGNKQISWFRWDAPASSNVQTVSEMTTPSTTRDLTLTEVTATLVQYGELAKISDVLSMTQLFDALKQNVKVMGQDAAIKFDDLSRDELVTNGTKKYAQGAANWAALAAAAVSASKFVYTDMLDAATTLKVNRAPFIKGGYVFIVPPQVARDIQNDSQWISAAQYAGSQQVFKGELGSLYGVRIIEATNPFREATGGSEGTYSASGGIYSSIMMGDEAFGAVELAGESPYSPRIIITKGADKGDPLDQIITVGWKAFFVAKILNANWSVIYKSKTAYTP